MPLGIGTARARLAGLADGGWLAAACAAAYQDGLDRLLWAWPPERTPARPSLTKSHFLDPIHRPSSTTMGMRWEATGLTGRPFPALDANITLTPAGGQADRSIRPVRGDPVDRRGNRIGVPGDDLGRAARAGHR